MDALRFSYLTMKHLEQAFGRPFVAVSDILGRSIEICGKEFMGMSTITSVGSHPESYEEGHIIIGIHPFSALMVYDEKEADFVEIGEAERETGAQIDKMKMRALKAYTVDKIVFDVEKKEWSATAILAPLPDLLMLHEALVSQMLRDAGEHAPLVDIVIEKQEGEVVPPIMLNKIPIMVVLCS